MRKGFVLVKLAIAGLIVAAIIGQFAQSWSMVADRAAFAVNFFSFFTILSNALSAVVVFVAAGVSLRRRQDSARFTLVRAAVVTYMTTTLVVYNLLLRDISLDQATTLPWSNEILHVWAPLLLLVDWVFAPGRARLAWNQLWLMVVFPLAWAVYTMVRGVIVGWYPYPFLDPNVAPGVGYDGVAVYVVAIAAFILLVGAGVIGLTRVGRSRR
ncbi:MAG TPA: Pr6Pr family membrane protein [Candidatus Lumbricidophila sp.]|nr:Pr6Pr family membrane protein [Candidatus Lumbricidophila sp.]